MPKAKPVCISYGHGGDDVGDPFRIKHGEEEDGCATRRRGKCRILEAVVCPPPPRKRTAVYYGKRSEPPKNGYFQPPDLESVFVLAPRRETCA